MSHCSKAQIYKNIIKNIMDSTPYTLYNIAELLDVPFRALSQMYMMELPPDDQVLELKLIKLYRFLTELQSQQNAKKIYRTFLKN